MMLRRHNHTETGRALAWQPCLGVPFGLTTCPNTPSQLQLRYSGIDSIDRLKLAEQQFANNRRMQQ
jgi:hypothetical protein